MFLDFVRLGFQFFLEMTCLGVIFHIQKDPWSLDDQNPHKKMINFYNFSLVREASDPVRKVPPLWRSGISDELHFFGKTRSLYGVQSVLPFSKLITGKSKVFSAHSYVYLQIYTQIHGRVPQLTFDKSFPKNTIRYCSYWPSNLRNKCKHISRNDSGWWRLYFMNLVFLSIQFISTAGALVVITV